MKPWQKTSFVCMLIVFWSLIGCGDNGGGDSDRSSSPPPVNNPILTGQQLADTVVAQWFDVDFSLNNPNGTTDTDFDTDVDTNDAVNFVESVKFLGYDIPETLLDGLYNNYYTVNGYDEILGTSPEISFPYTVDSPVTQADLQALDWSGLKVGDLIFTDIDKDFEWDFAGVYMGASNGYTHAIIWASDFNDKVVIEDLDDGTSIFVLDITFGFCDVRTPDYEAISNY